MKFTDYFLLSGCINVIISAFFWNKVLERFEALKHFPTFVAVLVHFLTGFFILPFMIYLFLKNIFTFLRYKFFLIRFNYTIKKLRKSGKNLKEFIDNDKSLKDFLDKNKNN